MGSGPIPSKYEIFARLYKAAYRGNEEAVKALVELKLDVHADATRNQKRIETLGLSMDQWIHLVGLWTDLRAQEVHDEIMAVARPLLWGGLILGGSILLMHLLWPRSGKKIRKGQSLDAPSAVRAPLRTASHRYVHMALSLRFRSFLYMMVYSPCLS